MIANSQQPTIESRIFEIRFYRIRMFFPIETLLLINGTWSDQDELYYRRKSIAIWFRNSYKIPYWRFCWKWHGTSGNHLLPSEYEYNDGAYGPTSTTIAAIINRTVKLKNCALLVTPPPQWNGHHGGTLKGTKYIIISKVNNNVDYLLFNFFSFKLPLQRYGLTMTLVQHLF